MSQRNHSSLTLDAGLEAKTLAVARLAIALVVALAWPLSAAAQPPLIGQWTFEPGEELIDKTGNFGPLTVVGAKISGGKLDVDNANTWAYARDYTGPTIRAKTLVSWVSLDSLSVRSGSILTLDSIVAPDDFDAIVYAERVPLRWMAGSGFFRRTQDIVAVDETVTGQVLQLAISYQDLGAGQVRITVCRNGAQIGQYTSANMTQWVAGNAEVIFGKRHTVGSIGAGEIDAKIEEARIYAGSMTCAEVGVLKLGPPPPPVPALPPCRSWGDVHIHTPDGMIYDYQAAGEFILAASADGQVVVQTRQEKWARNPGVSVNTAVSMNVNGDRVGIYLKPSPSLYVNDQLTALASGSLDLPNGGRVIRSGDGSRPQYRVEWPNGVTATARLFPNTNIDVEVARLSGLPTTFVGLCGNFDGNPRNDLALRDGQVLDPPVDLAQLNRFGDSWRISASQSLFRYDAGTNTATFNPARQPATRSLAASELNAPTRARARQTCESAGIRDPYLLNSCILDVGATGVATFAESAQQVATAQASLPSAAQPVLGVSGQHALVSQLTPAPAPPVTAPALAPVPRTGQTICYDVAGAVVTCGTGIGLAQDGSLRLGVAWPNPRFTKNGNGTVTDNLTGLIWLENAHCFRDQTWANALARANGLFDGSTNDPLGGDCGLSDGSTSGQWRLPNVREMQSLLSYGLSYQAVPDTSGTGKGSNGNPFSNLQQGWYWSSTSVDVGAAEAWKVLLVRGDISPEDKTNGLYVWPVRGGQ